MEKDQDVIEKMHEQFGLLIQEVSSYRQLLEDLIKKNFTTASPRFLRLLIKTDGRLIMVQPDDINWIEAWGDYVRLHCNGKSHVVRQKFGDIQSKLDMNQFIRVNRSAIINIDRIKEMEPMNHGDYIITLEDNTRLNLSRNYRDCLSMLFDRHL